MTKHWHWLKVVQKTKRIEHLQCFPEALSSDGKTHRQKQRRMDFYAQPGAIAIRWHWAQSLPVHLNRKIPDDSESLAKQNARHLFFSWSLYCSDCMLFLHSIFLVWILPKWSIVGQFATFCFATWTFKKDCWETSKTCNLGGFQVVRIWGQLYVKMTMTYPWRCGPMRFGYFRQLVDHVFFIGCAPWGTIAAGASTVSSQEGAAWVSRFQKSQRNWSFTVRREDDGEFEVSWRICVDSASAEKYCMWNDV